jgi:hypothetical protein
MQKQRDDRHGSVKEGNGKACQTPGRVERSMEVVRAAQAPLLIFPWLS